MNERIRELALQAEFYSFAVGELQSPFRDEEDISDLLEKFAEMIVRECAGIVDKIIPPGYEDYPDYRNQIEQSFRRECAVAIKEHFGVEE